MFNTKKNLLQRVRIAMVAIVTIMGIGSAFAMKAPAHKAAMTWSVVATVGNSYEVTQSAGRCDVNPVNACSVSSSTTPNSQNLIPKSSATILSHGNFIEN